MHVQAITNCLDFHSSDKTRHLTKTDWQIVESFVDELSTDAVGLHILPANQYVLYRYLQVCTDLAWKPLKKLR